MIFAILLMGCSSIPRAPHISGTAWACNNPICGKLLSARIRVRFLPEEKGQVGQSQNTLSDWEGPTTFRDSAKQHVSSWLVEQVRDSAKDPDVYYWDYNIIVDAPLNLDRSLLCQECKRMYDTYDIPINASCEEVNLKKAGFKYEIDALDAVAQFFGFRHYEEISSKYLYDECYRSACKSALSGITLNGFGLKDATVIANLLFRSCQESEKTREWLSKDPDQMTDKEWYDHMEQMSKDPTWKQGVRDQRKAKGID
jgi:hypothetical protein